MELAGSANSLLTAASGIKPITRFTVTATDSSGEAITLGLTPLSLPDNLCQFSPLSEMREWVLT